MSEEVVIRNCAPTLAGLKTGSMFSAAFATREELNGTVRALNRSLGAKGLRVLPLRYSGGRALIYVYRPGRLAKDLESDAAKALLRDFGYPCGSPEQRIAALMGKLQAGGDFPPEIGLFLGYPTEDVIGFIERGPRCSKCDGCWKVDGDPEKAQKEFARYKKCTAAYCEQWRRGAALEQLTVKS